MKECRHSGFRASCWSPGRTLARFPSCLTEHGYPILDRIDEVAQYLSFQLFTPPQSCLYLPSYLPSSANARLEDSNILHLDLKKTKTLCLIGFQAANPAGKMINPVCVKRRFVNSARFQSFVPRGWHGWPLETLLPNRLLSRCYFPLGFLALRMAVLTV